MAVQQLPASTNFQVHYEDTIPNSQARAQVIAGACENEFTVLTGWFKITNAFGANDRIHVYLDQPDGSGADNFGYQSGGKSNIHLDVQSTNTNAANAAEIVKMLFIAELVEVFMSYNNQHGAKTWDPGHSDGEALSQLCNIERFRTGHYLYYPSFVDSWLQTTTRRDWVGTIEATDGNFESFGCGLLFLYYLKTQLHYTVPQIIQKGGTTLEDTYRNLTGSTGGFNAFNTLVGAYFPAGKTPKLLTFDDPFPLLGVGQRSVSIDLAAAPSGPSRQVARGSAKVKPFFFCDEKGYEFSIESTPETVTCTATTRGFGQPVFSWRVNGIDMPNSGAVTLQATVSVDDTTNPQNHASSVAAVPVSCTTTAATWKSTLALAFPGSLVGHVDLSVEARAGEKFISSSVLTSEVTWDRVDNEQVVWEPQYYADEQACRKAWRDLILKFAIEHRINIILTLPDPPPDYYRVIRELVAIFGALQVAQKSAPETARRIEQAVHAVLGLQPELLGQIAKQMRAGG